MNHERTRAPHDPVPLVYVLSTGRSGSTLLDLLLGTHPGLATVGEFQLLPHFVRDPTARCGCGELLPACPFWGPLLDAAPIAHAAYPLDAVRETRDAGRLARPELLPAALLGYAAGGVRARARAYGAANAEALRAVAASTRATALVDASKDPYRLLLLARSGRFDLHVIHLVRDPRAVVFSFAGPTPAPRRAARLAVRWAAQQVLFARLARTTVPPDRTTVVRYEDLATDPERTMARVGTRLGVDPAAFDTRGFRDHINHAIAGNPMRGRDDAIAFDDRWRAGLEPRAGTIAWSVTAPVARAYGYRGSGS